MPHSPQFPILLMLPSDTYKVEGNTAVDKSGASFHTNPKISSHKHRTPMSHRDNSPSINGQLETVSSFSNVTNSVKSARLPDGGSIASATRNSGDEKDGLRVNDDADSDEGPRKKQKTQLGTGSTTPNHQIRISDALLGKTQDKSSTLVDVVDGGPRELRPQTLGAPQMELTDSNVMHWISNKTPLVTIENKKEAESTSTTSISPYIQTERSNPTTNPSPAAVIRAKAARSQDLSVKEEKESSIPNSHIRKRTNGLSGLLALRSSAMSKSTSTSDSLNSLRFKDCEEPPRGTRGLTLRPTNSSYGAKLKKSQGRIADQDELELWTNADVARIKFRKPHEQRLFDEMEEENAKRSVSHILKCLMETETRRSNENVARNDEVMSNDVQNQVAMPDSSIYARCDDLVEEIFGRDSRKRGMTVLKPKMGLVKQSSDKGRSSSDTDLPVVTLPKVARTNIPREDGKEIVTNPSPANGSLISEALTRVDQSVDSPMPDVMKTREFQVPPSHTSISGDGHQLDSPDVTMENISYSDEHKQLRDLSSENVTVLGKRTREEMITGERKVQYDVAGEDAEEVSEEQGGEGDELEMDEDGHEKRLITDEPKPLENLSKALEWMKIVKNIQPIDELGVAVTSDIEAEEVGNILKRHCPSIDNDENQVGEKRNEANAPIISLSQLEDWSIPLRSLLKGKKRFQHQDLINLKNTLQEIYNNRAAISVTSSLAQAVYGISQLGVHDVPNEDELELRALARKSTRYWMHIMRERA